MAKKSQGKGKSKNVVGACQCGGDVYWARVAPLNGNARMAKICTKCGEVK